MCKVGSSGKIDWLLDGVAKRAAGLHACDDTGESTYILVYV